MLECVDNLLWCIYLHKIFFDDLRPIFILAYDEVFNVYELLFVDLFDHIFEKQACVGTYQLIVFALA